MPSFEETMVDQLDVTRVIGNCVTNFQKLGRDKMSVHTARLRLERLEKYELSLRALNSRLETIATTEQRNHPYFTEGMFDRCREDLEKACDWFTDWISSRDAPTPPAPHPGTSATSSEPRNAPRKAKRPEIPIPTFNGSSASWMHFHAVFQAMIVEDTTLSDVERLHYLHTALQGQAKKAIQGLPFSENAFDFAWNRVKQEYGNPRKVVQAHCEDLLTVPTLRRPSYDGYTDLYHRIRTGVDGLEALGRGAYMGPDLVVALGLKHLDPEARRQWNYEYGKATACPSLAEFYEFMSKLIGSMDPDGSAKGESKSPIPSRSPRYPPQGKGWITSLHASERDTPPLCPSCGEAHSLYSCPEFRALSVSARLSFVQGRRCCRNCLSDAHQVGKCPSKRRCGDCRQQHHTLLHRAVAQAPESKGGPTSSSTSPLPRPDAHPREADSHSVATPRDSVILQTARVKVQAPSDRTEVVRALLDTGSSITLISEFLARRLRLRHTGHSVNLRGVGGAVTGTYPVVRIRIRPRTRDEPVFNVEAPVLPTLTRYQPQGGPPSPEWNHLADLDLADADFTGSDPIDLLIGMDVLSEMKGPGERRGLPGHPVAAQTCFGWVVSRSGKRSAADAPVHHVEAEYHLDEALRRFWETEDIPNQGRESVSRDDHCERHFAQTHSRTTTGRYVVRLPFCHPPASIDRNRRTALATLLSLERRFLKDPRLAEEYRAFLDDYQSRGHMVRTSPKPTEPTAYYIPHHPVIRASSSTTRLRVVFNASSSGSGGRSLNDCLPSGPKLQQGLPAIILRWRSFRFVYTADIEKMFRQILIHPRDQPFQGILWRDDPSKPVEEYQLQTVTYGTTSAPYQSLRVLRQLAQDEGQQFPLALPVLERQIYVDDFLFGAATHAELIPVRNQLIALLEKGGFRLRKWASNDPALLTDIDAADHGLAGERKLSPDEEFSVLGLRWCPSQDRLQYRLELAARAPGTKRGILSVIARLFDPLGWITPVLTRAKILIQRLWISRCEWDEPISPQLLTEWLEFYERLQDLSRVAIPRYIPDDEGSTFEIHGFADASQAAYAAVVYGRQIPSLGPTNVFLLSAKSRVSPIKTVSIPRLELSAALLLANLIRFIQASRPKCRAEVTCWTDSTITLWWLRKSPTDLQTFVANRVSAIHQVLPEARWRHVPTKDNPADCASRGLSPGQITSHPIWWTGPSWLRESEHRWPTSTQIPEAPDPGISTETKTRAATCLQTTTERWDLETRYASWPKLLRVTALLLRYARLLRERCHRQSSSSPSASASSLPSSESRADEIQRAKNSWLRRIQADCFASELAHLRCNQPLPPNSPLISLTPFLDPDGLLRSKGRLQLSELSNSAKRPILLSTHILLKRIIMHAHLRTLHGGTRLTTAELRQEYWILRVRTHVRATIHECVPCARAAARVPSQLMGDLPSSRVTPSGRAFTHTGVDYAGPCLVRTSLGRSKRSHKAYIAVFVCMTVKAIHLELVSDYTTAAFLAALHRFISRRGIPSAMYSDNGTNFKGAERELARAFRQSIRDEAVVARIAMDGITWHFSPPAAPHFGGLWEAAVRSLKQHLRRCIGPHALSFEEFATLLCQVEACLNSRPISEATDSIEDYQPLTPGHFLIGASLKAIPTESVLEVNENRLSRWQFIQRLNESVWHRWKKDYLHCLHQRPKWRQRQELARVGQLVLLRSPDLPPCRWSLGRIIECHPGADGIVRVVTIQTAKSVFKRPIVQLCFLPVPINQIAVTPTK